MEILGLRKIKVNTGNQALLWGKNNWKKWLNLENLAFLLVISPSTVQNWDLIYKIN